MPMFILPVEVHFHDPDWRIVFALVAAELACAEPEVAVRGAFLLAVLLVGLVAVVLAESRPEPPPCSTWALPRPPVM